MNMIYKTLAIIIISTTCFSQTAEINVMPLPWQVTITGKKFILDSTFTINVNADIERLNKASSRFLRRLSGFTGLFFEQDFLTAANNPPNAALQIKVQKEGKIILGNAESYSLNIGVENIEISAESDLGAMHAMETLLQLLAVDSAKYVFPTSKIIDKPRFPWRGLMIDASRHFMPLEVIKRNLDGMAAVKLNVLHWHLCDDQGFRVESKVYPNLHLKGSDGFYYTQNQIKEIIAYAADRGIRVVPEFDVPGHATSWIVAYPELGSGPQPASIERKWGILYQALNPASEYTYTFLDNFFGEMAALFPDKYFHIGGDELEQGDYHEAEHWNENKEIQAFMKKNNIRDNSALQAYFNSRLLKSLTNHGKILVGWDEILHENMPNNIVIQSWRGKKSMEKAAKMGYQSILSNGYYIDLIYPTTDHYLNDPLSKDIDLTAEQKRLILGGEATMWAEYVSEETIDSRIWPRTAAIAERFWSEAVVKDTLEMYRRLEIISYKLEEHGLTHIKNYEMMLRRLTNNQDTAPLKVLIDVIEPLKQYNRGRKRLYTSFSPLTRVADAARPDAGAARTFRKLVNEYLSAKQENIEKLKQIESSLNTWYNNHKLLLPIINNSPILEEIKTLSYDLAQISKMGLQAIEMHKKDQKMEKESLKKKLTILKQARRSRGQTELQVVVAIENLLKSAAE